MEFPTIDYEPLLVRARGSFLGRCVLRFLAMEGIDRCIVLSSQAFTALIPLLILVATLAPGGQSDVIATGMIRKFGLSGDSAAAVTQLFTLPPDSTGGVSIFSAFLLVFSGVSFTRRMQRMYRAAWGQEKTGVRGNVFAALGLLLMIAEVGVVYLIRTLVRNLPLDWLLMLPLSAAAGLALWTSIPYLLLNRQVHWRRLVVSGGLAATALAIYSVATTVYMPQLIEKYTRELGLFGITIALLGWLLAVAGVTVASAAIGAEFDASRATWAVDLKLRFRLYDPASEPPTSDPEAEPSGLTREDLVLAARGVLNWLTIAAAVWVAAAIVPGIRVSGGFLTFLWVSLILGLVNAVLGPLLRLVALPLTAVTLGLFALVVNGLLLAITAGLSDNLAVGGFGGTILGALIISLVTTLLELVVRPLSKQL
jgi:membrane protein